LFTELNYVLQLVAKLAKIIHCMPGPDLAGVMGPSLIVVIRWEIVKAKMQV